LSDQDKLILTDAKVLTAQGFKDNQAIVIVNGTIQAVVDADQVGDTAGNTVCLGGQYLVPGFVDLQVNGGGGVMFNTAPSLASLKTIGAAHRQFGTTGFMPTLISDDIDVMQRAIEAVDQSIKIGADGVLGIHLEGPFLNVEKKGAHDANKFRQLDGRGIEILSSLTSGKTIVTIAPELTSSESIKELCERGIIVCAGHSNASYEQITEAAVSGLTGVTHLYNAMTQLGSREPGMVGAALSNDALWFGIIADGHHMHDASLKIALNVKPDGGAILVTDAMASVGNDDKSFVLNGERIKAAKGRCVNAQGALAGSDLDMNSAIKNAVFKGHVSLEKALRMASLYPAKVLGLESTMGSITPGLLANLVALDKRLKVSSVWLNGELQ